MLSATPFLKVDDQAISLGQALKYLQFSGKLPSFIQAILQQHILLEEIKQKPEINATLSEVEEAAKNFRLKYQLTDSNRFEEWLTVNATDFATFHNQIAFSLKVEKLKAEVTEPNIEEYFLQRKSLLERLLISCLVVNDEKFAQELKDRILQGSSFEQLGREYAANPEKVINFRTGIISRGEMPEQMKNAVHKARVGELIEPFLSDNNWFLLRVEQLLPVTLDGEVKRQLQNELFEQWLREKMTKSKIQMELREGF